VDQKWYEKVAIREQIKPVTKVGVSQDCGHTRMKTAMNALTSIVLESPSSTSIASEPSKVLRLAEIPMLSI
jgi:hypothetical protein